MIALALATTSSWVAGPPLSIRNFIRCGPLPTMHHVENIDHPFAEPAPPAGFTWADGLGSYDNAPATIQFEANQADRAKMEAAAEAVMTAAAVFESAGTTAYAKSWTRRLLETGTADPGDGEFALCEECLDNPYSDDCVQLEEAIKALQRMVGRDWAGVAA
jgi:hypothetical protein